MGRLRMCSIELCIDSEGDGVLFHLMHIMMD